MKILNLRRHSGEGSLVALFDLVISPEFTLNDWQLRRTPKGLRAFPPSPRSGRPLAIVASYAFAQIGRLAATAFQEGKAPNDHRAA